MAQSRRPSELAWVRGLEDLTRQVQAAGGNLVDGVLSLPRHDGWLSVSWRELLNDPEPGQTTIQYRIGRREWRTATVQEVSTKLDQADAVAAWLRYATHAAISRAELRLTKPTAPAILPMRTRTK
jgi:hypothetical protein